MERKIEYKIIQHRNESRIGIRFAYNEALVKRLRNNTDARWSATLKCWHIADTKENRIKCKIAIESEELKESFVKTTTPINIKSNKIVKENKVLVNNKNTVLNYKGKAIAACNAHILPQTKQHLILKAYSVSTQKTYLNEISIFLQRIGNKPADDFTTERLKGYLQYCLESLKLSENTIHSRLNALKFYYEQVLKREKLFWEIPRPKKKLQLPKVFNQNDIAKIINAVDNLKHKTMLMLAYSAGLRVSEVVALKTYDIDSQRMNILIEEAKGKKDRIVTLSPVLLIMLREYAKKYSPKKNGYLFEGLSENSAYSTRSLQEVLQTAKKKAGIIRPGSIHSLRHSFATHLIEKGTDVTMVQKLLGHNDLKTTMLYLHTSNKDLLKIMSPLDDLKLN